MWTTTSYDSHHGVDVQTKIHNIDVYGKGSLTGCGLHGYTPGMFPFS